MTNIKEKTALGTANTGSGMGDQASEQAVDLPSTDFTTAAMPVQGLSAYLPRGAKNRVSSRELLRLLRIRDTRSLRALVARERAKGALILSSADGGYYLPDEGEAGLAEMQRFVSMIRAKGLHTLEAARPALNELRKIDGQTVMDLGAALDAAGMHEFDENGEDNLPEAQAHEAQEGVNGKGAGN